MICLKYQNKHISGKCLSILMFQNKPKRLCSLAKATNLLILQFFSIMFQLKDVPFRHSIHSIPFRCSIHIGIHLDEKLNYNYHVKEKITKAKKGVGVIKKLCNILPRDALLTIYK